MRPGFCLFDVSPRWGTLDDVGIDPTPTISTHTLHDTPLHDSRIAPDAQSPRNVLVKPTLDDSVAPTVFDQGALTAPAPSAEAHERCFLATTTRIGVTRLCLEQWVMGAALDVFESDPFPNQPADWPALLHDTIGTFFAPRSVFFMSYFLSDAEKRWPERVAACRNASLTLRSFAGVYFDAATFPARAELSPGPVWRLAFGDCGPRDVMRGFERLDRDAGRIGADAIIDASVAADPQTPAGLACRQLAWRCLAAVDPTAPDAEPAGVWWRVGLDALRDWREPSLAAIDDRIDALGVPGAPPASALSDPFERAAGLRGRTIVPAAFERAAAIRIALQTAPHPRLVDPALFEALPPDDTWRAARDRFAAVDAGS